MRRVRVVVVVCLVTLAALGSAWLARQYCAGGSQITNPDAYASERIAAGLRAVNH